MWRTISLLLLGALPATALGVMAFIAVIAASQAFVTENADKTLAALFWAWGVLGVAGVAGLWLAGLNRTPRWAVSLTVCGLIAAAPLVALAVTDAYSGERSWQLLLPVLPFGVGTVYVLDSLRKRGLWRPSRSDVLL